MLLCELVSCPTPQSDQLARWEQELVRHTTQRRWHWPLLTGSWPLLCRQGREPRSVSYSPHGYAERFPWPAPPLEHEHTRGQSNVGATLIKKDKLHCWKLACFYSPGGPLLFVALGSTQRLFFVSSLMGMNIWKTEDHHYQYKAVGRRRNS